MATLGEVTSLESIRKKRAKARLVKRGISIALFCIVIIGSVVLWQKFKDTDLKMKWNNFVAEIGSGPGYPIELGSTEVLSISKLINSPVLLTDSHLFIYNSKAKTMVSEQHGFNKPFLVEAKEQLLISNRGGKTLKIISGSGVNYEHKLENPIIDGDLSDSGIFGVVTESENFQGELIAYEKTGLQRYQQIFKWSSAENIITDLSISDDGKTIIAAAVNSIDGVLTSYIHVFKLADGSEIYKGEFKGEMILETSFKENMGIFISDKGIRSIDRNSGDIKEYSFTERSLYGYNFGDDNNIAVVLGDYRHNRTLDIISLDTHMKEQGKTVVNYELSSVAADKEGIYLIGDDKVVFYNKWLSKTEEYSINMVKKGHIIDSKLYFSTPEVLDVTNVKRPDNKKPE